MYIYSFGWVHLLYVFGIIGEPGGVVVVRPGRAFVCVCVSVFMLICFMQCVFYLC